MESIAKKAFWHQTPASINDPLYKTFALKPRLEGGNNAS